MREDQERELERYGDFAVAVVGMAGRFPGASDVDALWRNLRDGVESIRFFSDEELIEAGTPPSLVNNPAYVKAGSVLEDIELFDAAFFGYSPREAELIDPQQRIFLECAWQALEEAGYDPERSPGSIGIYAGATLSSYMFNLAAHRQLIEAVGLRQAVIGNAPDFLSTRVAYKLNLRGPAYSVQTACSTSLAAVHLACQGLVNEEMDMALAGGVSVLVPRVAGYLYEESGIGSPDGHTRPFDAEGKGTVFGSGVGIVVLKRLEDALTVGDNILAVIRGSAANNDGSVKVGFTAPSLGAQTQVISEALGNAEVEPSSIRYVEAHGTGTELGDPIEIAALTRAYRHGTDRTGFCAVGSVKSNLGHLDAASGISGLIKTILALHHEEIPPSLNYRQPSPAIDFETSPFFVATEPRPWPRGEEPRRAGVSSFGFGGTNVHLVLEEAPLLRVGEEAGGPRLLLLSAKSATALDASTERLAAHLKAHLEATTGAEPRLGDIAYTLALGRQAFRHRQALVAEDVANAVAALCSGGGERGTKDVEDPPVAFLFPGQGSQYVGMGRDLYNARPTFKKWVDEGAEILRPHLGLDLRTILFAKGEEEEEAAKRLQGTDLAQPALLVVEHALARQWMAWGVQPAAMLGHSIGEFVAATLAGVFSLEDALRLVATRGRLMAAQPEGAMAAVALSEAELVELLGVGGDLEGVSLAAVNGPEACTVAGPTEAIKALLQTLEKTEVEGRRLHTSHAFHSAMMEPVEEPFRRLLAGIELRPPTTPYLSNVTGTWIEAEQATDPEYWVRHLRQAVRFADGVEHLLGDEGYLLLEVGPGHTLSTLTRRQRSWGEDRRVISSMRHPRRPGSDEAVLLQALGGAWLAGVEVDWNAVYRHEERHRLRLPTYPFERERYWVDAGFRPPGEGVEADGQQVPAVCYSSDHSPDRQKLTTDFAEPATEAERQVAEIWRQALGLQQVGAEDDFFELGGDSLLGTRILTRLRDAFGVKLGLDQLFATPKIRGLAGAIQDLLQEEREEVSRGGEGLPPMEIVSRDEALPLSFAQERLWFLDQLMPGSPLYNMADALDCRGPLVTEALERAFTQLVARHESLRTTFKARDGKPEQVIHEATPFLLPVLDLTALEPQKREAEANRLGGVQAHQSCSLERGPLLRATLLRLEGQHHGLFFNLHHIVGDDGSLDVLVREVAALYEAFVAGETSPLKPLAVQYADFAAWQRRWFTPERLENQLEYWRRELEGLTPLELPTDRPRPSVPSYRGRQCSVEWSQELLEATRRTAKEAGVTLFMVLQAAFQVLLQRTSGQCDLPVGTPIANRPRPELDGVIGFFVNTLVLRADLSGRPTFRQLLERVRETCLGAYGHQDLPFERLVDALQPDRALDRTPLFQVMFSLQSVSVDRMNVSGLTLGRRELETRLARFDLTLSVAESDAGFHALMDFSTELFDPTTIQRWLLGLGRLLRGAVNDLDRPIRQLPLLGESEAHQIVEEWNGPLAGLPEGTLHGVFEDWAHRAPASPALLSEDHTWTYGELDARANQLAHHLRSLGVQSRAVVALSLYRSPESVACLLGILKVGAACLPLDPQLPARRLAFMLEDSGAALLVTEDGEAGEVGGVPVLALGQDLQPFEHHSATPVENTVLADQLAYLIYTSGSTGRPKGVMVSHRGMLSTLQWRRMIYGMTPEDRYLQNVPWTFDPSIGQIFSTFSAGATLVLAKAGNERDPDYLVQLLQQYQVTLADFPPSILRPVVEHEDFASCLSVRVFSAGGEPMPPSVVEMFPSKLPQAGLRNVYGPTEACLDASFWDCVGKPLLERTPIGRPIAGKRIYLLDRDLRPVPMGAEGQLWISGVGLARGYHRRPAGTAESFLPDPFAHVPGTRMYATGDLAAHLPGGELDFLGRIDHQVKVRGFRIELGEIELALEAHPQVYKAVVLARSLEGHKRLVAYVVRGDGHGEGNGEVAELRAFLAERLPSYMVPARFMFLASIPVTANEKVDRDALPLPVEQGSRSVEMPVGEAEEALAAIWRQVLGIERVGRHDNFFELGGDSILSIQVVARSNQGGLRLTPQMIFQSQTLAELATVAGSAPELVAEQGPVVGQAPLAPSQRWFFEAVQVDRHHWNQSVLFSVRKPLNGDLLGEAVAALVAHHDALRLRFGEASEDFQQTFGEIAPGKAETTGDPLLRRVDLADLEAELRPSAVEEAATQCQRSLNIHQGPLLRFCLFDMGNDEPQRLLMAFHHLAVDGVSWRILLEDLQRAYRQLEEGSPVRFPLKTTSWKAWTERLEGLARSSDADSPLLAELDHWQTEGRRMALPLPLDSVSRDTVSRDTVSRDTASRDTASTASDADTTEATARSITVSLSSETTQRLLQELPAASRTQITEVLLTALVEALAPWMGGRRLLVELESHGREELFDDVDLSRTVGWFTAAAPVFLDLDGVEGPAASLTSVKESLRRIPRGGIGYGLLRYLRKDPDLEAQLRDLPTPEISFNYLGQLDRLVAEDSLLQPATESIGPLRSLQGQRSFLLEINSSVVDSRLQVIWTFSDTLHKEETVQGLATVYLAALEALVDHWSDPEILPCYAPVDFPLAKLTATELDEVLAQRANQGGRIEDLYPLTPLQQGMLFETLMQPRSGLYVEQLSCALEGPLDDEAFQEAWRQATDRHPTLRAAFLWEGSEDPLQVVVPDAAPFLLRFDWRETTPDDLPGRLQAFLEEDQGRAFRLDQAPLMRLALLRTGNDRHTFVWTFHHLLQDGWSGSVILRDVFLLYRGLVQEQPPILPPLRPFRDYVAWLQAQDMEEAKAFWQKTLEGFTAATPLGIGHPAKDPGADRERDGLRLLLSPTKSAALEALGRRHQLTLNTLIQGAWGLILGHSSGQEDTVFGATFSGRPAELTGVEGMVGLFINTLPVRCRLDWRQSFLTWLGDLQQANAEIRSFEHTPLNQVHQWSEVPRDEPLFESLVVFENYPVDESLRRLEGDLTVRDVAFVERTDQPLVLVAAPGEALSFLLRFDPARFHRSTLQRLLHHLKTLLQSFLVSDGAGKLEDQAILTAGERHQLLTEWNEPMANYSQEEPIHEHIAAWAQRDPEAPAIAFEGQYISYRRLDDEASHLAGRLRRLGVGADTLVGLFLDRSPRMVVAMVGVWKAGGAYVPLDPGYPRARLELILETTQAPVLITEEALLEALPTEGRSVICLDQDEEEVATSPLDDEVVAPAQLDNLAYVIFTSGSTGRPKGVMIPHRGLINRLAFARASRQLLERDSYLQKASISFDVSLLEIFLPLLVGGTTVLVRPGGHQDPTYLVDLIRREKVTQAIFPPTLLRLLLDEPGIESCSSLHSVTSSAEAMPSELKQRFFDVLSADLYNRYGPTEASIAASSWLCAPHERLRIVPIGRPIAKARLYIVDRRLRPLAMGAVGELLIGGIGLARGYFSDPRRTALVFCPNPFEGSGTRLYRTGDLCRFRTDGAIEFLGRVDHQVKIRGFRVELGEIETILEEVAGVREVVVMDRQDAPGVVRLVAYFLHREGESVTAGDLREAARKRLPAYMVPSSFVEMEAFPLSPNGKVDRKALPAPEPERAEDSPDFVAPSTEREEQLAKIWAEVLGLPKVGVQDDYFELGGDSILSIRIVSRAAQAGLRISLQQLFEARTVARLAEVAATAPRILAEQGAVVGPAPLAPIQTRFLDGEPADPHHMNQAVLLAVEEPVSLPLLEEVLLHLRNHHDALRLGFERGADGWRQSFDDEASAFPVREVDLGHLDGVERDAALEAVATSVQASLDLAGELMRAVYFHLSSGSGRLLLVIHHLAVDGVSWRVLVEDLETAYRQRAAGASLELQPKTTSYQQWTQRLQELARSPELDGDIESWLRSERSDVEPLPADLPHLPEANQIASTQTLTMRLEKDATEALLRKVPEAFRTQINDALVTALARTLRQWTGRRRFLVDLEGHGRDHSFEDIDVTRTVGWFTTLYPVLLDLGRSQGPADSLKAIKEQLRAVPSGGSSYGLLRYGRSDGDLAALLAAMPAAQVSFNYLGQLDAVIPEDAFFRRASEAIGPSRSPRGARRYLLEINGAVTEGRLEMQWSYSDQLHRRDTIEDLMEGYRRALQELIDACDATQDVAYTPSDFGKVKLKQSQLDSILKKVGAGGRKR